MILMLHGNETVREKGRRFPKRIWIFALLWLLGWLHAGKLDVQAEPASLLSDGASVYGQMSADGMPIANLVQGSSFELLESVTAEDGSVWYRISAYGVEGYIRGDVEIGLGTAEPEQSPVGQPEAPDEEQPDQQEEDGGEEDQGVDAEPAQEETEGMPAGTEIPSYSGMNGRDKTYAVNSSSIKTISVEDTDDAWQGAGGNDGKSPGFFGGRISRTVLFFWLVAAGSTATCLVSYRKMRKELKGRQDAGDRRTENRRTGGNKKAVSKKKKRRKGKVKANGRTKQ